MASPVFLAIQSRDLITPSSGAASIHRISAACELIRVGKIPPEATQLWPQGYQRKAPTLPKTSGQECLGRNLADFCEQQPEMSSMSIIQTPVSWTTRKDMLAYYELVRRAGHSRAHIHFVTDWLHMKRVRLTWRMTHPLGWTAEFHPCVLHPMKITEGVRYFAHELLGIAGYAVILRCSMRKKHQQQNRHS